MRKAKQKQLKLLIGLAIGMFGFGYALVPLYDVFCDITGLNGKTNGKQLYVESQVVKDRKRLITVQFTAEVSHGMHWHFEPLVREVKVHPGELIDVNFRVKNLSGQDVIAQAVPSLSPGLVTNYFHKTECFCFNQQQLAGGKSMDMPLRFYVDADIPEEIKTLTLSYTLYKVRTVDDGALAAM